MPTEPLTIDLPDLSATEYFGRRLGGLLPAGSVVGLSGGLGAGKTHLVRAIAEGVGIADPRWVNSPTFVLVQEYPARIPICHIDTYRLADTAAFVDLGFDEMWSSGQICLIEWADRVESALPTDRLNIRLDRTGESSRRAMLSAGGPIHQLVVDAIRSSDQPDRAAPIA